MLGFFDTVNIILLLAVVVVVVFRRLKIPPIIGYLVAGILIGPHGFSWVQDRDDIRELADFGVVFLMFMIGLEFSLRKLVRMKHLVFGLGSAQVILTTLITSLMGYLLGMSWPQAVTVGCIVAMSSTAIVSKQLSDQHELTTPYGNNAISILLFQDISVIPFFILIASFAGREQAFALPLGWALIKTVVAFLVILAAGKWIMRPLFREIAAQHSLELFTLSALLVTLGASWLTYHLGLSLALGAFLAGIMLGETEFRHQIEATIRPFRDILLGIFFVSVGLLFDIRALPALWYWILLLLFALVILKAMLIASLNMLTRIGYKNAMRTGLILAQGGEFSFALLSFALYNKVLPPLYGQVVLGALLFSMALSPLIIRYNAAITNFILPITKKNGAASITDAEAKTQPIHLTNHVILCGYGHVGQNIARMLENENIPYIAIDLDLQRVDAAKHAGYPVIYGDSSLYDILVACNVKSASALVITFDDFSAASKILQQVRLHKIDIPIFVRSRNDTNLEALQALGATEVIPASLEASLMLGSHLLAALQVPIPRIMEQLDHIRKSRYQLFHEIIPGLEDISAAELDYPIGYCVKLTREAYAIGHTLEELALVDHDVFIAEICGSNMKKFKPELDTLLRPGDILMLYGSSSNLEKIGKILATGNPDADY